MTNNGIYDTNGNSHTNGSNTAAYTNGANDAHSIHTTNDTSHSNGINGHKANNSQNDTNGINGGVNGTAHAAGVNGNSHTNGAHEDAYEPEVETSIPIAICGMSLRLPGGSSNPQEFWDFLLSKGDARGRVPESRYNVSAYHSTSKKPGAIATEYGYFLDESLKLGSLDTSRFSLSRTELEFADPQQRRLLEVVREAFDDAGDMNFRVCFALCAAENVNLIYFAMSRDLLLDAT